MSQLRQAVFTSCVRETQSPEYTVPVSASTRWTTIHNDVTAIMTDANQPVQEVVADPSVELLSLANGGTSVLVRAAYSAGDTVPSIRVYGFDGSYVTSDTTYPMNLADTDGNIVISLAKAATDVEDENGLLYTEPVQCDGKGSAVVAAMCTVAGSAGVKLQAKVI